MPAKLRTKLKQEEFYCVKCRKRVKGDDICIKTFKNKKSFGGIPTMMASCKKCDTSVYKFIKHSAKDRLTDKYGKC
jgi:hypothetical protein